MPTSLRAASQLCLLLVLLLLPLASFGCSGSAASGTTSQAATSTDAETAPTATEPPPTAAEPPRQVRLRVESGPAGVVAFVKVYVRGKGPFAFSVDTGASHSVIDFEVVRKLGLKTIGDPVTITGIACSGTAGRLRIPRWRAGGIELPAAEIQTIDMPSPEIDGLLGSDILSTFGAITVDYDSERLLVGAERT